VCCKSSLIDRIPPPARVLPNWTLPGDRDDVPREGSGVISEYSNGVISEYSNGVISEYVIEIILCIKQGSSDIKKL
jgi:hypothetical protein